MHSTRAHTRTRTCNPSPRRARQAVAACNTRLLPLQWAISLALATIALAPAQAATRTYSGASGALWSATSAWAGGLVPVNGDDAVVGLTGAPRTATFASVYSGVGLTSLSLDFGSTLDQSSTSSAMVAVSEFVGSTSAMTSSYNQSGGSNTASLLRIGGNQGAGSGAYTLSGGSLNIGSAAALGEVDLGFYYGGTGAFTQTAGATNVVGNFLVGYNGVSGSVVLKGGSFNVSVGPTVLGVFSSGSFAQSGGSASLHELMLGYSRDNRGTGTYALNSNDGAATLNTGRLEIGVGGGTSSFVQTGNTSHTVAGDFWVGKAGSYALNGGTLNATGIKILAAGGVVTQTGGTLNLRNSADSSNAGSFAWTGGLLHFSGDASFADASLLGRNTVLASGMSLAVDGLLTQSDSSTLALSGGQVQVGSANLSGQVTVGQASTLSTAGRLSNFGSLQLAGGTLSGAGILFNVTALTGFGHIDGTGGFTNAGLLTQSGGDLVLSNTGDNSNRGTWDLLAGRQLVLSAADLSNEGQINLNGGLVAGSGGLVNTTQGTVSGSGRINTNFINLGSLVVDKGQTWIDQSFVNRGQILLGSNSANLAGGQIGNHGLIQGLGKINSNISNIDPVGVIEAQGGTLTLSGLIVSPNGGILAAGSGAKLLITQGLASNAGQLQLAGGTIDNNGKDLLNTATGVISGFGTLRGGTLTNNGQIQLSGGAAVPSAVYNNLLANAGSKTILSGNSNTTFYGWVDVQNAAELRVSTGSVATFFGPVSQRTGAAFTGAGAKRFEGGISVGASPGLGLDEGDVEFGESNVYLAEIGGITACTVLCGSNDAVKNSSFDKYSVAGSLTLGGALKLVSWNGFVAQAGQSFDLFDWGSISGHFASIDASGFTLAAGTQLDTSLLYSSGTISVTAVPEPGTLALWMAGLGMVGRIARRRRSGGAAG